MSTLTQFPYPVQWHEGMLLCPEHFQQTDRRIERLLSLHLQTFHPYYWGVKKLVIDQNRLVSGVLRIQELNAVLPDGTHALIKANDDQVLEMHLADHRQDFKDGMMTVNLALTSYAQGTNNVSSNTPRYSSFESIPLADENTGEGNRRMPFLKPNLMLIPGDTVSSRYESFPLLRVNATNNTFSIASDFFPPQIQVQDGDPIAQQILNLCTRMREKIAFISNRLIHQRNEIMSEEAADAVKALSISVLPLEAYLYSNSIHPFDLFVFLTQVAGQVSCLDSSALPPFFKAYDHHNLQATFQAVIGYINSTLDQIQEGYYVLPFTLEERLFTLSLKPSYMAKKMIFGARASKTMTTSDVATWLQTTVICSDQYVSSVRDKRILGAARQIISSDEDMRLLAPRDVILFAVDYDPSCMNPDGTLCIFNVSDTQESRPEELAFYLPKQKKGDGS